MIKRYKNLWIALGVLIILTPLGLIAQGTAFGEWGGSELKAKIGFVPAGFAKFSDYWSHTLLPDYSIPGGGGGVHSVIGYLLSAVVGVVLISGIVMLFTKIVHEE